MSEKTKKRFVIAGLIAVCIGLVFGISRVLYHEPNRQVQSAYVEAEEKDTVIDTNVTKTQPDNGRETEERTERAEPERELVIETDPDKQTDQSDQKIQKDPKKTEEKKPQEPPALKEDADVEDPEQIPAYEEEEGGSQTENTAASHGERKDGMIYVEGFGWIPNEGGGGSGTTAGNMYENGNKIGIME